MKQVSILLRVHLITDSSSIAFPAEHNWPRYKYVVQVVIGEQRGEAVRQALMSATLWIVLGDSTYV